MATIWFILIAMMLAVYAVLDGFDFGAGILHLFVARTDRDFLQSRVRHCVEYADGIVVLVHEPHA